MYYVNVLSVRKFCSVKEKEKPWPFLSQCSLNILQHILLHCPPSTPRPADVWKKKSVLNSEPLNNSEEHNLTSANVTAKTARKMLKPPNVDRKLVKQTISTKAVHENENHADYQRES